MDYDIEKEKRHSHEIRKVFREMFPLCAEHDLPWAACHIPGFLQKRIALEIEEGTKWFVRRVTGVLCEISPPKNHVEDMARIVVEQAKRAEQLEDSKAQAVKDRDDWRERAVEAERVMRLWSRYAGYVVTCAKSGEQPMDFDAFVSRSDIGNHG